MKKLRLAFLLLLLFNKHTAVFTIELYQKHLSPIKGWHCTYAYLYAKNETCSAYGKQAIQKYGLIKGLKLTLERTRACYHAGCMLDSLNRSFLNQ